MTTLKLATAADLPLLASFVRAYHDFEGLAPLESLSETLEPLLTKPDIGRIWLILHHNNPIGYATICVGYSIEFAGRDAFLDELFIAPEYRSQGIGTTALRLVKLQAAELGIKALHLEVDRDNHAAQRLYQKSGFVARNKYCLMTSKL